MGQFETGPNREGKVLSSFGGQSLEKLVRDCRPPGERWFDLLVGRSEPKYGGVLGVNFFEGGDPALRQFVQTPNATQLMPGEEVTSYQFGSFALDESTGTLYMIRSLVSADRLAGYEHAVLKSSSSSSSVVDDNDDNNDNNPSSSSSSSSDDGSSYSHSWTDFVSHEDSKAQREGKGFGVLRGLAIDSRSLNLEPLTLEPLNP
jgi:hypothetical protein